MNRIEIRTTRQEAEYSKKFCFDKLIGTFEHMNGELLLSAYCHFTNTCAKIFYCEEIRVQILLLT